MEKAEKADLADCKTYHFQRILFTFPGVFWMDFLTSEFFKLKSILLLFSHFKYVMLLNLPEVVNVHISPRLTVSNEGLGMLFQKDARTI